MLVGMAILMKRKPSKREPDGVVEFVCPAYLLSLDLAMHLGYSADSTRSESSLPWNKS